MERLICCDARDGLASLPDASVDLIVTDVPYRVISGGNTAPGRPTGILDKNDGRIFRHNDIHVSEYAAEFFRVLKTGTHCYVMVNLLNLWVFHQTFLDVGFQLHNLLEWKKQNATPNRWYMNNGEYVLFLRKGVARTINNPGSKRIHEFANPVGNKHHETEKPIDLMKYYIENSSQPGDVILDPFVGSGSTGLACQETGRDFIGFEIDPVYHAVACRRMGVMP